MRSTLITGWGYVAVLLALLQPPLAQAQSALVGRWHSREVHLVRVDATCVYVENTEAIFDLASGINSTLIGTFSRVFHRAVWSTTPTCTLPGVHALRDVMMRFDKWSVISDYIDAARQHIVAHGTGCSGDCADPLKFPQKFEMQLQRNGPVLTAEPLSGVVNSVKYRSSLEFEQNEAGATKAFWDLYKPLVEGNCNQFFVHSLDPEIKRRISQGVLCKYGHQLAELTPLVMRTEPAYAFSASIGTVPALTGPLLLRPEDVLVQRFLVFDQGGSGVAAGAVLRRNEDNIWKIVDFVP
jgi:hypothetical protein